MPDLKETIAEIVDHLAPPQAEELLSFAKTLLERQEAPNQLFMKQSWAGALRDFRGRYTSGELQKRAL
ncbi:MAG: DUF2281 domain-containing protein, partial [Candidatus Omnitrophica bacterium]|nr:DUF2281 domain-containing protein [Candidatus Omnitrophota bacterium]